MHSRVYIHTHIFMYITPDRFLHMNLLRSKCKKMLKVVNKNCQVAFQNVHLTSVLPSSVYSAACWMTPGKHLDNSLMLEAGGTRLRH